MTRICTVDGCDLEVTARGWCRNHYARWLNAGKPDDWIQASPTRDAPAPDDATIAVARAHGTKVAAEWSQRSEHRVRQLRLQVDGYYRGCGHPTLAELAARAPRINCPCGFCIDHRTSQVARINVAEAATRAHELHEPSGDWRLDARCAGVPLDVFFPDHIGPASTERYDAARAMCAECPVTQACLEFAVENRIPDGIFGGLDPNQRARLTPRRPRVRSRSVEPASAARRARGNRKPLTDDDPRHGTVNAYTNLGCRCAPCREANRQTNQSRSEQRTA